MQVGECKGNIQIRLIRPGMEALQEPCSCLPWPAAKLDSPSLLVPLTAKEIWAVKVGTISRLGAWKPLPSLDPLHEPLPCPHPHPSTPPHPIWHLDFSIYSNFRSHELNMIELLSNWVHLTSLLPQTHTGQWQPALSHWYFRIVS